jgi:hypothetical protein
MPFLNWSALLYSYWPEVIFFPLLSLFFIPLMLPSVGVFDLAGSFRCLFLLFGLSARFMLLGSFLRGFIFC